MIENKEFKTYPEFEQFMLELLRQEFGYNKKYWEFMMIFMENEDVLDCEENEEGES